MIEIIEFEEFIASVFYNDLIKITYFKEDVHFIDIDCFPNEKFMLTIALTDIDIRIATISKEPEMDFSLYDYFFNEIEPAKSLILNIKISEKYPLEHNL